MPFITSTQNNSEPVNIYYEDTLSENRLCLFMAGHSVDQCGNTS